MLSEAKILLYSIYFQFVLKSPLSLRNIILRFHNPIIDRRRRYKILSLYDEKQRIIPEIKKTIIESKGDIVIGDSIVKCWLSGIYSISGLKKTKKINLKDNLFFSVNGLYYNNELQIAFSPEESTNLYYVDFKEYCDENIRYYAFRTSQRLYVSENLSDWKEIYNKKRGIKNSMVFANRGGIIYLIFIEYTSGEIRERHHILEYSFSSKDLRVAKEFFTYEEYLNNRDLHCCRHIHVIERDPFTNDIYVGTGDNDVESAIWISRDNGNTYNLFYRNGQLGRTLSFMFTQDCVFWATDTHEPQYIIRFNRKSGETVLTPVVNGALWHSFITNIEGRTLYIIGSNSEGAYFDNNNRVYGVALNNNNPHVYELTCCKSWSKYDQLFPIYVRNNVVFLYDILGSCIRKGKVKLNKSF